MTGLCIVGGGGHGKVVADCAAATGRWDRIAFLDDSLPIDSSVGKWRVVGHTKSAAHLADSYADLIVAVGNNTLRTNLLRAYLEQGLGLVTIVHPRAYVSDSAVLGQGSVVMAQAAVNIGTSIGRGGIINTGAVVDHDCTLGEGVHICPGASLAGTVEVGDRGWIGIGASVINAVRIGSDVIVGAGAAVISNVAANSTVVGVPAAPTG